MEGEIVSALERIRVRGEATGMDVAPEGIRDTILKTFSGLDLDGDEIHQLCIEAVLQARNAFDASIAELPLDEAQLEHVSMLCGGAVVATWLKALGAGFLVFEARMQTERASFADSLKQVLAALDRQHDAALELREKASHRSPGELAHEKVANAHTAAIKLLRDAFPDLVAADG